LFLKRLQQDNIFFTSIAAVAVAVAVAAGASFTITSIPTARLSFHSVLINSTIIIIACFTINGIIFDIVSLAQQDQLALIMHGFYIS
jgi:hypothetical protein